MFWKKGGLRVGIWPFWRGQVWWVTMCVTNRALPYSMSNDILRIVLYRVLVRRVVSLPKEKSGKNVWQTFSRPSKLLILEGTFAISKVSLCFLVGFWWSYCCLFSKHSCSVHFCLMNLVMISQTAQCWSTDGLSKRFEVGEREFDFWHQKMSVWLCLSVIIVQFVSFELF